MMHKALIIEDNADIARLVQMHLRDIQCEADIAVDGESGLQKFKQGSYELVVLDLMLPGMDGLAVCQKLRAGSDYVPILMLTAKASELDRVVGLEMGADDYLTKPFSIPELQARVKALFRRVAALQQQREAPPPQPLVRGQLTINIEKRQVKISGSEISLTAKEFDLLLHFASHPGRVYSRMQLLEQVWGYHYEGYQHTVNSHINRLRAKIEQEPTKPRYILTAWGVGYKFSEQER
ncbi:MAG: response regulator transcription factor [Candidatus Polarisedimenticolaceae bacterium]|nr:response regulator transcription factor [Candidatus Polarisedimenticolaceae bacterium]